MKKHLLSTFILFIAFLSFSCKTNSSVNKKPTFTTHNNKAIHLSYKLHNDYNEHGKTLISVQLDESIGNIETRYINTKNETIMFTLFPKEKGEILYEAFLKKIHEKNENYQLLKKIVHNNTSYFISKKSNKMDGKGNPIHVEKNVTMIDFYNENYGYYNIELKHHQKTFIHLDTLIHSIYFSEDESN